MSGRRDEVVHNIDILLSGMSSSTPNSPTIYEVDQTLRQVNKRSYTPGLVAIGPIHRNKSHLKAMEQLKVSYLHQLLRKMNESMVERYVVKLRALEEEARNCYSNLIQLPKPDDEFVKMLLLDGFFVVVLLRKLHDIEDWKVENEYIFHSDQVHKRLAADLLLVENQLPFFILSELFDMTKSKHQEDDLSLLVLQELCWVLPWKHSDYSVSPLQDQNHVGDHPLGMDQNHIGDHLLIGMGQNHVDDHLLEMVQNHGDDHLLGKDQNHVDEHRLGMDQNHVDNHPPEMDQNPVDDHLLGMVHRAYFSSKAANVPSNNGNGKRFVKLLNTVSELDETGISFKVDKGVMDVSFTSNKVIQVSHLTIDDYTETMLRNFIAYEQMHPNIKQKYVSDYSALMTYFVHSSKDVEILRRAGIYENVLGDDETVHRMFNQLARSVIVDRSNFCYTEVSESANKHCSRRRNEWMAKLKRNYFNISVVAAIILLLLTTTQTVFTILPYL